MTKVPRSCPATQLSQAPLFPLLLDLIICTGQLRRYFLCESFRARLTFCLARTRRGDNVPSHEDVRVTMAMPGSSLSWSFRHCITCNSARGHPIIRASFCDRVRCRTPRTLYPSLPHGLYLFELACERRCQADHSNHTGQHIVLRDTT